MPFLTRWIATACGLAMTPFPVIASAAPARRAQDATQWRSRVERGIGRRPTKQSSRLYPTTPLATYLSTHLDRHACGLAMTPFPVIASEAKQSSQSNSRRSHPYHCERSTSPQGAGRHAVAVPNGTRDWPQANKVIQPPLSNDDAFNLPLEP